MGVSPRLLQMLVAECATGISEKRLLERQMPEQLQSRLAQCLKLDLHKGGEHRLEWDACGKAKYHEFTPGKQFSGRKARVRGASEAQNPFFQWCLWCSMQVHEPSPQSLPVTRIAQWSV